MIAYSGQACQIFSSFFHPKNETLYYLYKGKLVPFAELEKMSKLLILLSSQNWQHMLQKFFCTLCSFTLTYDLTYAL